MSTEIHQHAARVAVLLLACIALPAIAGCDQEKSETRASSPPSRPAPVGPYVTYLSTVQPFTDALIRTRMLLMTSDGTNREKFNAQYREVLFQQTKVDPHVNAEDRQRASWIRAAECVRLLEIVRSGMDEFYQLEARIENHRPSPDPTKNPKASVDATMANMENAVKLTSLGERILPDQMAKAVVEIHLLEKDLKEKR